MYVYSKKYGMTGIMWTNVYHLQSSFLCEQFYENYLHNLLRINFIKKWKIDLKIGSSIAMGNGYLVSNKCELTKNILV